MKQKVPEGNSRNDFLIIVRESIIEEIACANLLFEVWKFAAGRVSNTTGQVEKKSGQNVVVKTKRGQTPSHFKKKMQKKAKKKRREGKGERVGKGGRRKAGGKKQKGRENLRRGKEVKERKVKVKRRKERWKGKGKALVFQARVTSNRRNKKMQRR